MKNEDCVEDFLNLSIKFAQTYKQMRNKYESYSSFVNNCDKATQDLLHFLELNQMNSSEKLKMATKISNLRKDRRYFKDKVEALEEIINGNKNWGATNFDSYINKLENVAGNYRKKYLNRSNRKYSPRIINKIDLIKG